MSLDNSGINKQLADAGNSQITDAVNQANLEWLLDQPPGALANLYQATAQALANASHNALSAQQQAYILNKAALDAGITLLYPFDTNGKETADADVEAYLEGILAEHRKYKLNRQTE